MKPDNPIVYNEFYLDAMTGGSSELPAPVTPEQHYLAYLAGMAVTLPQPIILRDKFLAKICGMDVNVPTYIPGKFPRKFAYYAKAAGQDVDVPQPITREEMYWFNYVSGQPSEKEYTGAVPVTFTADGTPLLDYLISGNTVQSATSTPDSPIMPNGTGERTGNLWSIAPNANIGYNQDVDSDVSETPGLLHVSASDNGMILTADSSWAGTAWKIKASVGMTYYISFGSMSLNLRATIYTADGNNKVKRRIANYSTNFPDNKELTILSDEQYIVINISVNTIATVEVTKAMITTNIIPYELYGYKIPISSASTTTPVYLGEVQTTRKIKKLVLTGNEAFSGDIGYNRFFFTIQDMRSEGVRLTKLFCTHYQNISDGRPLANVPDNSIYTGGGTDGQIVFIKTTDYTTVADFKSYLASQYAAGTPVTVWYVLATDQTGIVNEPLMKIGEYADTLSMEQANVEIPTARGTNTLDVLTDVKPSEIYIKYKE